LQKIGPIPIDDDVGKEIITRLTTDMVTNSTFYTDSNGRDFLKRVTINLGFHWIFDMINLFEYYYFFQYHTCVLVYCKVSFSGSFMSVFMDIK
jgi:hypothetical protein